MQNFSPWSAWRVTRTTVLYHEFCHRVRFFGTKRAHTFLCSSWPWTVLYAPLSETPCSLRFMHYVLSDTYICTTQSPVADVPGRLDRCCRQHLSAVIKRSEPYQNCVRNSTRDPTHFPKDWPWIPTSAKTITWKTKSDPTMHFDIWSRF